MKRIKLTLVFCIVATILFAQNLTLDECHRLASENYPAINKYNLIEQSTEVSIQKLNMGYVPQLAFLAQASIQSDVPTLPDPLRSLDGIMGEYISSRLPEKQLESGNYGFVPKDQYRIALSLEQVIWDGGTINAQKNLARVQGEAQKAESDVDMYALRDRVNNLFFGILLLDEKIQLLEAVEELLLANYSKLDTLYSGGLVTSADKANLKAELISVQQQIIQLQYSRSSCSKMLSLFVGKSIDEYDGLQKPSLLEVLPIENKRPELEMMNAKLKIFDAQEKLVNTSVRPRLSIYGLAMFSNCGYDIFKNMFARALRPDASIGIQLKWNISNFYTYKKTRKQLEIGRQMVESGRETFLFNMGMLDMQNTESIVKFREMMRKDEEIVELRTEIRESTESKLEGGLVDINALLADIQKENKAKNDLASHEIELLKQMYELKNRNNN